VGEHVGVGMAGEPLVAGDLDPAEHEALPRLEAVAVVPDADTLGHGASLGAERHEAPLAPLEDANLIDAPAAHKLDRGSILEADVLGEVGV
jgi:hypothetical protein